MITNNFFMISMMIASMYSMKTKNPVMMSLILLSISSIIFFKMHTNSGHVWFPLIFFLIFMGGILMMFMILSSILPNEKSIKLKKIFFFPLTLMPLSMFLEYESIESTTKMMKSILDSSSSMFVMVLMMLMYFFISISMVSKEETPMRNTLC